MDEQIEQQLKDINKSLGEAGGVAWMTLYGFVTDDLGDRHQIQVNVTARDLTSTLALEQLMSTVKTAKEVYHMRPYPQSAPKKEDPFAEPKISAPAVLAAPSIAPTTAPTTAPASGNETFHCNKIQAGKSKDNIKLDFYTDSVQGKTKFPYISQYVSIERALAWFQPFGNWTAEHFTSNQEFAVNLNVTWAYSNKINSAGNPYKDVIKIEAA